MVPASAQTLRYANQGDLKSLDPYTLNETTTHAHLGQVYEGLIARDKDLKIIPGTGRELGNAGADPLALPSAQGRQVPERRPLHRRRRACSRRTASAPRARTCRPAFAADAKVVKVDDYTVDFILTSPNPILNYAMGYLVHHGQEMGRGEQRRRRRRRPLRPRRALPRSTPTAPAPSPSRAISPASRPCSRPIRTGGASPSIISRKSSSRRSAPTPRASPPCCRAKSTSSSRFRSRIFRASIPARTRRC